MSDCEQRMALLRPYLSCYKRRFTVLDLGCGDGQIARAIAREYGAVVVVIEKGLGEIEEYGLHHYDSSPRVICLKREVTLEEVRGIAASEHFDVVLALNVLHWTGGAWSEWARTVLSLGCDVFVQIPSRDATEVPGEEYLAQLTDYLDEFGRIIGYTVQFPGHPKRPLWYCRNGARRSFEKSTLYDKDGALAGRRAWSHCINAEYWYIYRLNRPDRPWIAGMNLWNFCCLGGVRPSRERIVEMLRAYPLPAEPHGDIAPWNFILDGARLHLIDGHEGWQGDDRKALDDTIRRVEACLA